MHEPRRIDGDARMSQAVVWRDLVFLSGQVDLLHRAAGFETQMRNILARVEHLLARAGSSKSSLLMATIWLRDVQDFETMNRIWEAWIDDAHPPARATVQARLVDDAFLVEIAVIAAAK